MVYAIRKSGSHETLVEFPDWASFDAALKTNASGIARQVSTGHAHAWVKAGREHETGFYLVDGEIAYATKGA